MDGILSDERMILLAFFHRGGTNAPCNTQSIPASRLLATAKNSGALSMRSPIKTHPGGKNGEKNTIGFASPWRHKRSLQYTKYSCVAFACHSKKQRRTLYAFTGKIPSVCFVADERTLLLRSKENLPLASRNNS